MSVTAIDLHYKYRVQTLLHVLLKRALKTEEDSCSLLCETSCRIYITFEIGLKSCLLNVREFCWT
jgi:hypothetical protein